MVKPIRERVMCEGAKRQFHWRAMRIAYSFAAIGTAGPEGSMVPRCHPMVLKFRHALPIATPGHMDLVARLRVT